MIEEIWNDLVDGLNELFGIGDPDDVDDEDYDDEDEDEEGEDE
jgi:hypothetical protein